MVPENEATTQELDSLDMTEAAEGGLTLEHIWQALSEDQFLPYFQPKVSLRGMQLEGVEALIRWRHPQRGTLSASAFLPLVHDNFLFDDLTTVILEKSIAQYGSWRKQGLDVAVSVNLSSDLFRDPGLAQRILSHLEQHAMAPTQLTLEVSERALVYDLADDLEALGKLRASGFGLAIDDYGSGHCTPRLLEQVPASELKLDRNLLAGAARRMALRAQLEEALDIGRELGFTTVAEGVENQEEWDLVNELGCDMAQGYFIARPMSGDALVQWHQLWLSEPFI